VLTRALVSVLAAGLAAVLMLAAGQQAALAGGGPGGGNLVGSVTCGQSYSPQCDVTAGSGPSAGTPAGPGGRSRRGRGGGAGPGGSGRTRRPDPGAAQPGDPLQPRPERPAAHELADLAVDQPGGVGAGVEDGDGAGGERDGDRHPVSFDSPAAYSRPSAVARRTISGPPTVSTTTTAMITPMYRPVSDDLAASATGLAAHQLIQTFC